MCLIIKTAYHLDFKPLIAKRDITCYKVLLTHDNSGNKKYTTPYKEMSVLNNILIADSFQTNVSTYFKRVDYGIHSFQTYKKALSERDYLNLSLFLRLKKEINIL